MRVFLDGSSSWADKPLAGFSALDRMASTWRAGTSTEPKPFPDDFQADGTPSIWVSGLFPLWEAGDLDFIRSTASSAKALWLYPEKGSEQGVLRLSANLPKPDSFDVASLELQYGSHLQREVVSSPNWQALRNGRGFAAISDCLFARNLERALAQGVCITAPGQTWIEDDVHLDAGVLLGPNVYLARGTRIEAGVSVQLGCHLKNVTIASGTVVKPYSVLEGSEIGQNASIGPFANIRTGTVLGAETKIGNFVETKKTVMGKGSKASHLTYLGDAEIGSECNIGAGTITCNYDGYNKWKTQLGDRVFIGSDSQLIAPVTVASDAFVAAGSTVTSDIPENGLAIARSKQVTKPNRASAVRERAKRIRYAAKDTKS